MFTVLGVVALAAVLIVFTVARAGWFISALREQGHEKISKTDWVAIGTLFLGGVPSIFWNETWFSTFSMFLGGVLALLIFCKSKES